VRPILTIAIPTYNNNQQLNWCIRSLFGYTEFPYKVVIVNNSPENNKNLDHFAAMSNVGELLTVKHMGENAGWMGGINAALAECDTEFFCMMNDDVVFLPGHNTFWRKLWECMQDEGVGAAGPCSNFVAGCQSLLMLDVPELADTRLLIGFCLLTRTQLLKDLGGLDACLPGGDDLDLSIRIRKAGLRLMIRRDCYLHHFGQQTGKKLFGDQWDSKDHQEAINNSLIRKHGVKEWHDVITPVWDYTGTTREANGSENEVDWMAGNLRTLEGEGLNLGCGSMKYDVPGLRIQGVDLNNPGEHGTGGTKYYPSTPDIVGDAVALNFALHESMDVLIAQHLIEHLLDPILALERWFQVLKPGGTLLVTAPDQSRMETILLDCTHLHAYTADSLRRMLSRCGFRVHECRTIGWGSIVCRASKDGHDELI
jgi:GT2 family glycosyltransferase